MAGGRPVAWVAREYEGENTLARKREQWEERDRLSRLSDKTPLQKTLAAGMHGLPELKKEEKQYYLGIFKERVVSAFTFAELDKGDIDQRVAAALEDPRAGQLRVHSQVDRTRAMNFIQMARDRGVRFNLVSDPRGKTDIALVIEEKS